MKVKRGQVLYYHEISPLAKIIQKKTNGPYNHCSICIEDNIAIDIRPCNMKLIDLTFEEENLKAGEYIDIKTPVWGDMEAGILKARELFHNVKGYSIGGITAFFDIDRLRREHRQDYESDEYLICSESQSKSLTAGKVKDVGNIKEHSFKSPNDCSNVFVYDKDVRRVYGV
jgi:hypothetical protein